MTTFMLVVMAVHFANAQNLVPDSSFENNTAVPIEFSAINTSGSWNMPSLGTTDLFCRCDRKRKKQSLVDVPQNPMGYQNAHSGTCYAGLFAFSHGDYREYLQTPLKKPLTKNKSYLFTMYISLADYSRTSIDQLGICFLRTKANYNSSDVITDLQPVYIKTENDVLEWRRMTAVYKAHGGEQYIVLGSFEINKIKKTKVKAPKEVRSRINQSSERDAYYFIDDVSLVELPDNPLLKANDDAKVAPESNDRIRTDTALVLKNVLFQTNETELMPSSFSELDLLANYLKKNPEIHIEIIGHTDNSGNEKVNKELSTGRAKAIAGYLLSKEINNRRITIHGYGSTRPLVANDTEEHKQQNRRVEFILHR